MRLLDVKAERAAKENEMKMIRNEVSGRVQIQPQIQLFDMKHYMIECNIVLDY